MGDRHHRDSATAAFAFTGNWRAFAPIAFTNLLLTIVTLGIYSFWAKTRERRYLWSQTRFIDDRLAWTGTGLELLLGYLIAFGLILVPITILNLTAQGLVLRGNTGAAALLGVTLYIGLLILIGVARFRALRYRLSRTYWHGIRGGSDDPGLRYGVSYLWRTAVGALALGLMVPWSMTTLWNRRWNKMSFGPLAFASAARWQPVFKRYILFYLVPFVLFFVGLAVAFSFAASGPIERTATTFGVLGVLAVIGFYVVLGLIAVSFYAAFFREGVRGLTLGSLDFAFEARTKDWLKLFLGDIALVVCTLGIGYIFLGYRHWSFFIRYLEAYGEVDLDTMTQSATRAPGQGEGLLDAFDVGAF